MSESSAVAAVHDRDLLGIYCNDHLAAAVGGIELVSRMLSRHRGNEHEQKLEGLLDELREERSVLVSSMQALELPVRRLPRSAVAAPPVVPQRA